VIDALAEHEVESSLVRVVDHNVLPGVLTDQGDGDGWPAIHDQILGAEILIIATPTWVAQPSSVAKQVVERMDAMLSETDDDGRPVAFNRVAGFVVAELTQAVTDVGFTVPGQAFTYWNMGPGPVRTTPTPSMATSTPRRPAEPPWPIWWRSRGR
jgi:multimeric flavodoxin WrbA